MSPRRGDLPDYEPPSNKDLVWRMVLIFIIVTVLMGTAAVIALL